VNDQINDIERVTRRLLLV